jgi:methylated-DNA-[protein]-cysteine S-methyltransferase
MPHTLFPTAFGHCGIAWNDNGLTAFQLPEASAALAEQHLARKAHSLPATEPPPAWVQGVMERVQRHLGGQMQDFTGTVLDWSRVTDFQQAVYLRTLEIKPG